MNLWVYKKSSYNATHMFSTIGRNYKYLVIGDQCDYQNVIGDDNSIAFLSPIPQSNYATYEFVRRLYSLLDEEYGTLVITKFENNNNETRISVFDVPYLHENTLSQLGKQRMKLLCRLPFLYSPIGSFKVLWGIKCNKIPEITNCPLGNIVAFCESRNIRLKYYKIK